MQPTSSPLAQRLLSVLRIMTALIVLQHGMYKLFQWPPDATGHGPVALVSIIGLAGIIEFFGGLLVLVGLFTRPAAFLLSGQMAAAYFLYHAVLIPLDKGGFFPIMNGGDLAIMLCFVFLYLSAAGAGPWSIDALRRKTPRPTAAETLA